jgi:hypothetical protein
VSEKFNVVQFFADDTYEVVREDVSDEEAVNAAFDYFSSVGARAGTTRRVIITTQDDAIAFEWKFGEGITFPKQLLSNWAGDHRVRN